MKARLLFLLVSLLTVIGCQKDDSPSNLLGTWVLMQYEVREPKYETNYFRSTTDIEIWEFQDHGNFYWNYKFSDRYTISDTNLVIGSKEYYIERLSSESLIVITENDWRFEKYTFRKLKQ